MEISHVSLVWIIFTWLYGVLLSKYVNLKSCISSIPPFVTHREEEAVGLIEGNYGLLIHIPPITRGQKSHWDPPRLHHCALGACQVTLPCGSPHVIVQSPGQHTHATKARYVPWQRDRQPAESWNIHPLLWKRPGMILKCNMPHQLMKSGLISL